MEYKKFIVFYWATDKDGHMVNRNIVFPTELSACTFVMSICKDTKLRFDRLESVY